VHKGIPYPAAAGKFDHVVIVIRFRPRWSRRRAVDGHQRRRRKRAIEGGQSLVQSCNSDDPIVDIPHGAAGALGLGTHCIRGLLLEAEAVENGSQKNGAMAATPGPRAAALLHPALPAPFARYYWLEK
jgi:hypothetical protein